MYGIYMYILGAARDCLLQAAKKTIVYLIVTG